MSPKYCARALALAIGIALPAFAQSPDHHEFDAALDAPYAATKAGAARDFRLMFRYDDASDPSVVAWRLALTDASGKALRAWYGEERLLRAPIVARVAWD